MKTATLQAWMDEHGPLGPHEAALIALGCLSRLMGPSGRGGRNARQIDPAHIERRDDGYWTWVPDRAARGMAGTSERESVIAIGRLMHAVLAATPPGSQALVPIDLRKVRPDLPAPVAVLVGDAVSGETSLD